jgi:Na+-driven multidrug efflux pump
VSAALISLKLIFMNYIVSSSGGANTLVAFSVAGSCFMLISLIITGVSQSTVPILGVLYGEKNYSGIRFLMKYAYKILFGLTAVVVLILEIFPGAFAAFFGVTDAAALSINETSLRIIAISFFGTAFAFLFVYYCQTIGKPVFATVISFTEGFVILIPTAALLAHFFGANTIWFAYLITDVVLIGVVFAVSKRIAKQTGNKFRGFLALPDKDI